MDQGQVIVHEYKSSWIEEAGMWVAIAAIVVITLLLGAFPAWRGILVVKHIWHPSWFIAILPFLAVMVLSLGAFLLLGFSNKVAEKIERMSPRWSQAMIWAYPINGIISFILLFVAQESLINIITGIIGAGYFGIICLIIGCFAFSSDEP